MNKNNTHRLSITGCDVCGSRKKELFLKIGKHQYEKCLKCGTIYLATRNLNLTKKRDHTYLENVDAYLSIINPHGVRYMAGNIDHAYATKIGSEKGKLLEIGAGLGYLSYTLFARDWDVTSLELSSEAIKWSEKVFKLPVEEVKIEDYKQGGFKAFVMVEVIEHIYNPLKALKHIKTISAGKALLFGTTPNIDSEHWKSGEQDIYQPHDHIVLFNKKSLTRLLKKAGYKKISISYFGTGEKFDSNLMYSAVIKK